MKVTIESIDKTKSFGDKGFTKREFIGVDNSNTEYPQPIKFEGIKDMCIQLDGYKVGQVVDVEFNIRGNRWMNKEGNQVIFNSLQVWKITPATSNVVASNAIDEVEEDESELPF